MSHVDHVALPGTQVDPLYPDSDGRPMGDTEFHTNAVTWLREALQDHFTSSPDVYVASVLVMYYKQGDPQARRDPDVLVARGVVGKHRRRSFRIWEEKVAPSVLFEVASRDTWRADVSEKPKLYARLGVKEYFVYDPEGIYLDPVLQGFRTVRRKPVVMAPTADGALVCKQLGLRLVPEGEMLRLIDLPTGQPIPTRSERTEQERQRAEQERRAREEAEQRAEQMAEEIRRLRALLHEREDTQD
jgi:Uma2 family endonuclease